MKLKIALCAESIVRDIESNQLSAFNILDQIVASSFPFVFPKLTVVGVFEREENDLMSFDIELDVSHNKTSLFNTSTMLDFQDKLTHRYIFALLGVVIIAPGQLVFTFKHERRKLGSYILRIDAIKPQFKESHSEKSEKKPKHNQHPKS